MLKGGQQNEKDDEGMDIIGFHVFQGSSEEGVDVVVGGAAVLRVGEWS